MPFWERKPEPLPESRSARQLRQVVTDCVAAEVSVLDDKGVPGPAGRCRFQEYNATDRHVLVDLPTRDGQPIEVGRDHRVRVAFSNDGSMWAFETTVLDRRIYKAPQGAAFPVLALHEPDRIESANRRRAYRVQPLTKSQPDIRLRADLAGAPVHSGEWISCQLHDISSAGIGVWIHQDMGRQLRAGHAMEVALRLPAREDELIFRAVIRRTVDPGGLSSRLLVGMEFDVDPKRSAAEITELAEYVSECEREIARQRRQQQ